MECSRAVIAVLGEAAVDLVETAERGVYRARPGVAVERPAVPVDLMDNVGAGDASPQACSAGWPIGARWARPAAPRCATSMRTPSPHSSTGAALVAALTCA